MILDDYLSAWDLSNPVLIAETVTSHIYTTEHAGKTVILKLLTPLGEQDEQQGAVALRHFAGRGAVHLLREDAHAHLLEYASGDDLVGMASQGQDEQATRIIAEVLNQLHAATLHVPIDTLPTLTRWFRELFHKADADGNHSDSMYVRGARVARELLASPVDERVLHGDMHHENVRSSERGWLAFDPKGLYGERTYDAANILCNPIRVPALILDEKRFLRNAHILAEQMDIPFSRLMQFTFAYTCLSASWFLTDGGDPSVTLRIAEMAEKHL